MHAALRKTDQFNETFAVDTIEAANDNIAQNQTDKVAYMPASSILSWLFTNDHISQDERDAGEHTIKLASIVRSSLKSPIVRYTVRDADRKWRQVEQQRHAIKPKLDTLIDAIRYEPRRRATVQALVVDDTNINLDNPHRVAQGLADVARHLWGKPSTVTPIFAAANDNQKEVDEAAAKGKTFRRSSSFDRLFTSGNLDADSQVNEMLYAAGLRFGQDHYAANMDGLKSADLSREVVDCGGQRFASEAVAAARSRYRDAIDAMGARYAKVVEAVAVHGRSLGDVGAEVTHFRDRGKAIAAAGERLNGGLRLLAKFYGILR